MPDFPYGRYEPPSPMPPVVVIEDEHPAITEAPKEKPAGATNQKVERVDHRSLRLRHS
jgi:hypothetical protein